MMNNKDDKDSSGSSGSDETVEEFAFQFTSQDQGIKEGSKYVLIATFGI